ncbi:transcriptional repressor [Ceraceosorus bombacis]|uniref:Transcriptional repressor n=1 Tax=Ceraceosorus bombacis TaxID=401625 RepID=A0A0P1BMA2_9BASI|nr:transcriptional repressor [Ceraceosorus bombacis]
MPPRHHHSGGATIGNAGGGGSPFPPLGLAAAGAIPSGTHTPANNPSTSGDSEGNASSRTGLPPSTGKVDTAAAQSCRVQDAYWSEDEEDMDCPLCLEEIDMSDANFRPCPCGYQICRFCWHHIKQNLNGRCPACRRKYSDQAVEFTPMTPEEIKRLTLSKRQKEREKRELEQMNRRHLSNVRVVVRTLVYVTGLSPRLAREELIPTLRSNEYFGQYGRISKILISKRTTASKLVMGTSESALGVYITYHRKEDAARAIVAIDGSKGSDGRTLRASFGTTKYCTTYLRNLPCTVPTCTYLHEPGEETDTFTKEDLSTLRHATKDAEFKLKPSAAAIQAATQSTRRTDPFSSSGAPGSDSSAAAFGTTPEGSALPKTASWASAKAPGTPIAPTPALPVSGVIRDSELPSLAAATAAREAQRKASSHTKQSAKQQAAPSLDGSAPASPAPVNAALAAPTTPASTSKSRAAQRAATAVAANEPSAEPEPTELAEPLEGALKDPSADMAPQAEPLPAQPDDFASRRASDSSSGKAAQAGGGTSRPPGLAPPGLIKVSATASAEAPPGLGPPRVATPATNGEVASPPYQPSLSAQALLDDMRVRRDAGPRVSPFPSFEDTLRSFESGGDFSFNLSGDVQNSEKSGVRNAGMGASAAGSFLFGGPHGIAPFGAVPSGLTTGSVTFNGSADQAGVYNGSFDPFAEDAGKTIIALKGHGDDLAHDPAAGPFAAIDQMRRTLSEERAGDNASNDDDGATDADTKQASRFGFAKRKESDVGAAGTSSPFLRPRSQLFSSAVPQTQAQPAYAGPPGLGSGGTASFESHGDPLAMNMRDNATNVLGSVLSDRRGPMGLQGKAQDVFSSPRLDHQARSGSPAQSQQYNAVQQYGQSHASPLNGFGSQNRHESDFGSSARESPLLMHQQQHRTTGPPPGFGVPNNADQQHYAHSLQQQQHSQAQGRTNHGGSVAGVGYDFLAQLQRGSGPNNVGSGNGSSSRGQAFASPYADSMSAQQQQQRHGNGGSTTAATTPGASGNASEPLLAQIMAAAAARPRSNAGGAFSPFDSVPQQNAFGNFQQRH